MEKTTVLQYLKRHVETELKASPQKDKREKRLLSQLGSLSERDISFGPLPKYVYGYLECNSTGVGRSTFGNTETQRTVSRDYVTDEILFIDGHEATCKKGLELLLLKQGERINYFKKSEMKKAANHYGVLIHGQYFRDLNFSVYDHRVNRYVFRQTKQEFSAPIRAVFMKNEKEDKKILLGYVYEKDRTESVLIDIDYKELNGKGLKNLLIPLGILFPPLGFILLVSYLRNR